MELIVPFVTFLGFAGLGAFGLWKYSQWCAKEVIRKKEERIRRIEAYEKAKEAYFDALGRLKGSPNNPDLKTTTLELGRLYADLTRKFAGDDTITLFDEVALMNDINAASAGATAVKEPGTLEERLRTLDGLRTKGLLTNEEYDLQRSRILDGI